MLNLSPLAAAGTPAHTTLLFGLQRVVLTIHAILFELITYGIGASPQNLSYLTDTTVSFLENTYFAPLRVAQPGELLFHTYTLLSERAYGAS